MLISRGSAVSQALLRGSIRRTTSSTSESISCPYASVTKRGLAATNTPWFREIRSLSNMTRPAKMTVEALRQSLAEMGVSTRGQKSELMGRLRKARKEAMEKAEDVQDSPDSPNGSALLGNGKQKAQTNGFAAEDNPFSSGDPASWVPKLDTFLVTDIEATCEITPWVVPDENGNMVPAKVPSSRSQARKLDRDYPSEIIEFPIILLQWNKEKRCYAEKDRFHSYVKPIWRPGLSKFCRDLTGIEQASVDAAPTFNEVERQAFLFLKKHDLLVCRDKDPSPDGRPEDDIWARSRYRLREGVAWVTHGPSDLLSFIPKQTWISRAEHEGKFAPRPLDDSSSFGSALRPPLWMRGPIMEIRKSIAMLEYMGVKYPGGGPSTRDITIEGLLEQLNLGPFQGRVHSGIDDATNIARLVIELGNRVRDAVIGVDIRTEDVQSARERAERKKAAAFARNKGIPAKSDSPKRSPSFLPPATTKFFNGSKPRLADIQGVEYACLRPNLDTSRVADKKWSWQGKTPGSVLWKHPPDPTSLQQNHTT